MKLPLHCFMDHFAKSVIAEQPLKLKSERFYNRDTLTVRNNLFCLFPYLSFLKLPSPCLCYSSWQLNLDFDAIIPQDLIKTADKFFCQKLAVTLCWESALRRSSLLLTADSLKSKHSLNKDYGLAEQTFWLDTAGKTQVDVLTVTTAEFH